MSGNLSDRIGEISTSPTNNALIQLLNNRLAVCFEERIAFNADNRRIPVESSYRIPRRILNDRFPTTETVFRDAMIIGKGRKWRKL